ncbi:hypothetical protein MIMGU_mgv1a025747mg, partial [Erythranthe guttata]
MSHLPEVILVDILFKSVCRDWNSIISSQHFVKLQLKKSISSPSCHMIFMQSHLIRTLKNIGCCKDLHSRDNIIGIPEVPMPVEARGHFLGTCDGLFCYLEMKAMRICVWNPSLRISKTLDLNLSKLYTDKIYTNMLFFWFGRESSDADEYKVVLVYTFDRR